MGEIEGKQRRRWLRRNARFLIQRGGYSPGSTHVLDYDEEDEEECVVHGGDEKEGEGKLVNLAGYPHSKVSCI